MEGMVNYILFDRLVNYIFKILRLILDILFKYKDLVIILYDNDF